MTYDELNRLKTRTQEGDLTTKYDYDANGNLSFVEDPKHQAVSMLYDELNRLDTKTFTVPDGVAENLWRHTTSIDYDYDENGNLTDIYEHVASGLDPPEERHTHRT
jgi:YD repeat-containing protein